MKAATITDRRRVLRAMAEATTIESARTLAQIAADAGLGVEKTRASLRAEYAARRVRRRRSWASELIYWLDDDGKQLVAEMREAMS